MSFTRRLVPGAAGLALAGGMLLASPAHAMNTLDSTPCTARLITAHEGYQANADGDTVESQIAAYDIGANAADSDIWKTKDNYYVQRHDNDLSTTTNAPAGTLITNLTLAQVKTYTTRRHHEQIPQVLDSLALVQFKDPYRYLQFETKWSMNGHFALDAVDAQIQAAGFSDHVIIYSAYLSQLQYLSTIDPALTLWYKAPSTLPDPSTLTGLEGVMVSSGTTKAQVTTYHNAGFTVIRGKILSETQAAWDGFVRKGADAMMTVDPATVIPRCRALTP
ncbi:MAG: glycerophosphodiester phosphodiesterase [Nocardioidaceae bacterium]